MMTDDPTARARLEEPHAELEKRLIHAYLAGAGQDYQTLVARDDEASRQLLAAAARYASEKLSEVEARSRYVHSLHGHS